jgi:hypothetical protein
MIEGYEEFVKMQKSPHWIIQDKRPENDDKNLQTKRYFFTQYYRLQR